MLDHAPPRLDRGFALDRQTFCIALSGRDPDDTLSHILIHEGRRDEPWSRYDIPEKIAGLTGMTGADGRPLMTLLTDEGDVYRLPMDSEPSSRRIEGAGVYADDATDLGYVNHIAPIGDSLIVTGYHGQLYRVTDREIDWFQRKTLPETPATYDYLIFGALGGTSEHDLYMAVTYSPTSTNRPLSEAEEDEMDRLYLEGRRDEAFAIRQAAEGPSRVFEGRLYHWNGQDWRIVATPRSGRYYPEPATISDILTEPDGTVWAVGDNGIILRGNAEVGFTDVSDGGNGHNFSSITRFGNRMVLASDYGLHWFDGTRLAPLPIPLDPAVNNGHPTPVKVQAIDDVLYVFDYKHGVHVYDGATWTAIEMPSALLARDIEALNL